MCSVTSVGNPRRRIIDRLKFMSGVAKISVGGGANVSDAGSSDSSIVYNLAVWLLLFAIVNMKLLLVLLLPAVIAKPAPESPTQAHHHHGACK